LTSGWKTIRIGEWGEVRGGRQRSPHITAGRMRRYLRVANVFDGFIDTSDVLQMPFTDKEFRLYALQPGDILLNEGQSSELVGRSAIYEGPVSEYAFQNTLIRFRPGPECESLYAHEVFRHLWRQGTFESISKKTTSIAHLGVTRFANLLVRVPSLGEQMQVSHLLREFNAVLAKLSELIAAKRVLKRGLIQALLTERRRLPELADTPWDVRRLGDVVTVNPESLSAATDPSYHFRYIDLTSIQRGRALTPPRHVRFGEAPSRARRVVRQYDVLFATVRPNLQGFALVDDGSPDLVCSTGFAVLRAQSQADAQYVFECLFSDEFQRQVEARIVGSSFPALNADDVNGIQVPWPTERERAAFGHVLGMASREIGLLEDLRQRYEGQKSGLMRLLLSGELSFGAPAASELEATHV
jgi:type I restriction enzyme, S subunit